MKANELRIGNWVSSPVYENGMQISCKGINIIAEGIQNRYEPIPLTEEWLVKFGFKRWSPDKKRWTIKNLMIYHNLKDGFAYGKEHSRVVLKHVHQLQNLYFALTGEELTIKDKKT